MRQTLCRCRTHEVHYWRHCTFGISMSLMLVALHARSVRFSVDHEGCNLGLGDLVSPIAITNPKKAPRG